MLWHQRGIGSICVMRQPPCPFTVQEISLLTTFADQAVIAIQNARLFDEVQARTRDLTETLQQQTATADVLKVISASPGELEPVFQAMLQNAVRLCEAKFAMLFLYEENQFRAVGKWNIPPAYGEFLEKNTILADPKVPLGRVAITKQSVQVEDVLLDQSYIEGFPRDGRRCGRRRRPDALAGAYAQGERPGWDHRHLPSGSPALYRQTDCVGAELRRAGRHRHRECPPSQ